MLKTRPTIVDEIPVKIVSQDGRVVDSAKSDDDTPYEEAVKHLMTPNRRRTNVSAASFAAIRRAVGK